MYTSAGRHRQESSGRAPERSAGLVRERARFDGLFSQGEDGALHFHEASQLSAQDTEHLERTVRHRVLRLFVRRGLIED